MSYHLINQETGGLLLGLVKIKGGDSLAEIQKYSFFRLAELLIENQEWKTYKINPIKFSKRDIGFNFLFKNNQLKQVTFSSISSDELTSFKINNKILLEDLGYINKEYNWGKVSSFNDPRSGVMVVINYKLKE